MTTLSHINGLFIDVATEAKAAIVSTSMLKMA